MRGWKGGRVGGSSSVIYIVQYFVKFKICVPTCNHESLICAVKLQSRLYKEILHRRASLTGCDGIISSTILPMLIQGDGYRASYHTRDKLSRRRRVGTRSKQLLTASVATGKSAYLACGGDAIARRRSSAPRLAPMPVRPG